VESVYGEIGLNLKYIADYKELLYFEVKMNRFSKDEINKRYPRYSEYNELTAELRKMFKQRTFKEKKDMYEKAVEK
jgi:hypothetical protein